MFRHAYSTHGKNLTRSTCGVWIIFDILCPDFEWSLDKIRNYLCPDFGGEACGVRLFVRVRTLVESGKKDLVGRPVFRGKTPG